MIGILLTTDPTLHHKMMGHLLNSNRRQMCKTERNRHLSELVVNIETGAKLNETIGTVEELGIWHDEWTMTMTEEERRGREREASNVRRVTA